MRVERWAVPYPECTNPERAGPERAHDAYVGGAFGGRWVLGVVALPTIHSELIASMGAKPPQ